MIRVGGSTADVVDEEVTSLADLNEGDVRRGYVVSAGSVGVLIRSLAQPTVGSVPLAKQHFDCEILLPRTFPIPYSEFILMHSYFTKSTLDVQMSCLAIS